MSRVCEGGGGGGGGGGAGGGGGGGGKGSGKQNRATGLAARALSSAYSSAAARRGEASADRNTLCFAPPSTAAEPVEQRSSVDWAGEAQLEVAEPLRRDPAWSCPYTAGTRIQRYSGDRQYHNHAIIGVAGQLGPLHSSGQSLTLKSYPRSKPPAASWL